MPVKYEVTKIESTQHILADGTMTEVDNENQGNDGKQHRRISRHLLLGRRFLVWAFTGTISCHLCF
jgi:hypothetical protein